MQELRVLYIEDDPENREELKDALSGEALNNCVITLDCEESFENAAKRVQDQNYHLVIIDLMKGSKDMGSEIYNQIRSVFFTPIIFYSAKTAGVESLKSQVIGVASKFDGIDALKAEIDRLTKHGLPLLREKVHHIIEQEFKRYFWDTIQSQNNIFKAGEENFSLGYLLLRKFADSLSKENIKEILHDEFISTDKVHPMEFYVYPTEINREYECGEIIKNKDSQDIYVVLTPSCDFIKRAGKKRKVEHVLLAKTVLLNARPEYTSIVNLNDRIAENNQRIKELDVKGKADEALQKEKEDLAKTKTNKIASFKEFVNSKYDRYFFLPGTPFIEDRVIDFQDKLMVSYESLKTDFDRLAKLDNPYAQSMLASFIRYYNRIGFPDIDTDYIINRLGL